LANWRIIFSIATIKGQALIKKLKSILQNKEWRPWLGGVVAIAILIALWFPLSNIKIDLEALRNWIQQLGPLAPVAFVLLNMVQIVVAPIPGYPVQALGGVLFGFVPGSIYTVAGMVAGGVLAAWLARRLGRPWLEKRIGAEQLDYWTGVAHINSFWMWWVILVIPFGDIPYFIAGLTRIRLSIFALAIALSRGPFTVLIVWTAQNAIELPFQYFALIMVIVLIFVVIGFSQAKRIEAWGRKYVSRMADHPQRTDDAG
jgi:uncharacterized membrane protein YdjX (TVP38/TMEM64 family)